VAAARRPGRGEDECAAGLIRRRTGKSFKSAQQVVVNREFDMISIVKDLAAEALFVSDLQPSQRPSRETVEQTVTAMILRHGSDGCAAGVAAEFGDHPEVAVWRMHWVHTELTGVLEPRTASLN
jgi:hypothetical protein